MKCSLETWFYSSCILFLTRLPTFVDAIQCYRCTFTQSNYQIEAIPLCSEFDYSERFIVNCEFSTFCKKRSYTAKIPVQINGTERDCAQQKLETQNYINGTWIPAYKIEQPYTEGCKKPTTQGLKTGSTEECYCNSNLCNSAPKTFTTSDIISKNVTILILIFFVINKIVTL